MEAFPREMASGASLKTVMIMAQEQGYTSVCWEMMMSIAV